jgi:hypothetical protein
MINLIICFFTITLLTPSLYGAVEPAVQYNYATELGELTKRVTAAKTEIGKRNAELLELMKQKEAAISPEDEALEKEVEELKRQYDATAQRIGILGEKVRPVFGNLETELTSIILPQRLASVKTQIQRQLDIINRIIPSEE